ncbi:unnamed protein product [Caenorhabditis sp. 36 PRJEB53466]|nr:unnamed protein product [Caenorhabditis sp. 36 PRJEB53466]
MSWLDGALDTMGLDDSNKNNDGQFHIWIIVLIVIGALFVVAWIVIAFSYCCGKRNGTSENSEQSRRKK